MANVYKYQACCFPIYKGTVEEYLKGARYELMALQDGVSVVRMYQEDGTEFHPCLYVVEDDAKFFEMVDEREASIFESLEEEMQPKVYDKLYQVRIIDKTDNDFLVYEFMYVTNSEENVKDFAKTLYPGDGFEVLISYLTPHEPLDAELWITDEDIYETV